MFLFRVLLGLKLYFGKPLFEKYKVLWVKSECFADKRFIHLKKGTINAVLHLAWKVSAPTKISNIKLRRFQSLIEIPILTIKIFHIPQIAGMNECGWILMMNFFKKRRKKQYKNIKIYFYANIFFLLNFSNFFYSPH